MDPDGITKAYHLLAYDLYLLEHHRQLSPRLLARLRNPREFQGARYELFVAATFIRAGFTLEHIETDRKGEPGPEFGARNRSGATVDVEAKSRHRDGVLGRPGQPQDLASIKLGIHRILNDASKQARSQPFILFLDLNMPPEFATASDEGWINVMRDEVNRFILEKRGDWPYSLIVVTNCPHHHGEFGGADPHRWHWLVMPGGLTWAHQMEVTDAVDIALRQYGNVPNFFPDDPRSKGPTGP